MSVFIEDGHEFDRGRLGELVEIYTKNPDDKNGKDQGDLKSGGKVGRCCHRWYGVGIPMDIPCLYHQHDLYLGNAGSERGNREQAVKSDLLLYAVEED